MKSRLLTVLLAVTACAGPAAQAPAPGAKGPLPVPPPAAPSATAPSAAPAAPVDPPVPERQTPDADFRARPPAPGQQAQLKLPELRRFKLKNGLQVMLAEMHDLPMVSMTLVVKTGGGTNPRKLAGLADMTANMLDEGTKTRSAMAIADRMATLGATLSTGASWDASSVALSTLTRFVDDAAAVWADVILNPSFDAGELKRVRENLLAAIARRKDSPPAVASIVTARVLYGDAHPYAWPQSGVEESVKQLAVADLRRYHETYYRPNNAAVLVAGDIGEADLRAKLEKLFGGWKPRPVPVEKLPVVPLAASTRIALVDKAGGPQSSIRVASVGVSRATRDYFPLTMMNLILGGSFHRLDLNLRESKGWSYGVRSAYDMRRAPGPWSAGGEFDARHTAEAVKEILSEIRLMRDADVGEEELARARDQVVRSFPSRFATRAAITSQIAELFVYDLPESYLRDFTTRVTAVTAQEIRAVARKYLDPEKLAVIVVGDRDSLEKKLSEVATVELRDLDGAPAPTSKAAAAPAPGKEPAGD